MMIAKGVAKINLKRLCFERPPEGLRRAEGAEGPDALKRLRKFGAGESHPFARHGAAAVNGRGWVVTPDEIFDASGVLPRFDPSNEDRLGAGNVCEWLPKAAEGEDAAAERVERVDEDDVEIAVKARVLEAVIEEEEVRMELRFEVTADGIAIGGDPQVGVAGANEDLSFVAG